MQLLLVWGPLGQRAPGSGPAALALVEQVKRTLDAGGRGPWDRFARVSRAPGLALA